MSPNVTVMDEKALNNVDRKNFLDVNGVRITPPVLEFRQAFEGKTYKQKLSIQNIGTSTVTVRILAPTSFAYKIKPVRCLHLSPGLRIVREVLYVYSSATSPSCILPIYVNSDRYDYHLYATVSSAEINVYPTYIDFGSIDAGYASPVKSIVLQNIGTKPTKFFIDNTTTDDYSLIVEPMKGLVQASKKVIVHLRLIGRVEGPALFDVWVKADKPCNIVVVGNIIKARFEPVVVGLEKSFILVDFPITYVGLSTTVSMYVRNFSASEALFCLMGEMNRKLMTLDSCRKHEVDYRYFDIQPIQGMFLPKQIKVIHFKFQPKKVKRSEKYQSFYFCIIHVCRVRSKFLSPNDYKELYGCDVDNSIISRCSWTASFVVEQNGTGMDDTFLLDTTAPESPEISKPVEECNCVKFYLHAVAEQPSVSVTPDELYINEMLVGRKETRVLELKNNSSNLPIILVYKKVAFVDLEQTSIYLKPNGSFQVAVYVAAKNIGVVNTQIRFLLVFYDYPKEDEAAQKTIGEIVMPLRFEVKSSVKYPTPELNVGITPKYLKETGKYCQDVRFNAAVAKPQAAVVAQHLVSKSSSALMALPNDTRQSLRPWRANDKCKTIFTRNARYVAPTDTTYELTVHDKQIKMETNDYYTTFLRRKANKLKLAKPAKKPVSEYDLSTGNKVLCNDLKLTAPPYVGTKREVGPSTGYFPLLLYPIQIINVIIDPPVVLIGPIGANKHCEFKIKIENRNSNTISVFFRPDKPNVVFPEGNRKLVDGNGQINVTVVYISQAPGTYSTDLKVVLNDCAFSTVDILAHVQPITLNINTDTIVFGDDEMFRYLEIANPMDSEAHFRWTLTNKNFRIRPTEGIVRGNQVLSCYVQYFPGEEGPSIADADFLCGGRSYQQIRLNVDYSSSKVYLAVATLAFEDIPLNMPVGQMALLNNSSNVPQSFRLLDHDLTNYIDVFPTEGVVYAHSYSVIFVTVKFTACVRFEATLKFSIARSGVAQLLLTGNVVFPEIVVQPNVMNFGRIPCSTMDSINFVVENKSIALATVKFDMSRYPEFTITETDKHYDKVIVEKIVVQKQSSRHLCLRFTPYATARDKFPLPMIINDILGPMLNDDQPAKVVHFLTSDIPGCKSIVTPSSLNSVEVQAFATEAKLLISKLVINLKYGPSSKDSNSYNLVITNCQKESDEMCIRKDALIHPLYFEYSHGKDVVERGNSITCCLDPQEEVCFDVSFRPDRVGTHLASIPIFLRSDYSKKPHTFINIEGSFPAPTIKCMDDVIYFKPLPLKIDAVDRRKFLFENHFENCSVKCTSIQKELELKVVDGTAFRRNIQEWTISCRFRSERCQRVYLTVSVYCTCGYSCDVSYLLIAENCFLTNYALVQTYILNPEYNLELKKPLSDVISVETKPSLTSLVDMPKILIVEYDFTQFFSSYPFYPPQDDPLYNFMNTCVTTMETWMYTQGFFGTTFHDIPNGIAYISDKPRSKKEGCVPPFIQLLFNMFGDATKNYFELSVIHEDEKGARDIYNLYNTALDILTQMGAYFTFIFPQYLMPYKFYRMTITSAWPENKDDNIIETSDLLIFANIAKQAWLDLLLQTYKVSIFPRLIRPLDTFHPLLEEESSPHKKYRNSIKNISRNNHLFSTTELLLLNWLEFHYNLVRLRYWADNRFLSERDITYFGENMDDGFIYAAATLSYCPYLGDHFSKLCPQPLRTEEIIHNNIVVRQSWDILNLNVGVSVSDLTQPHPLKTLTATAYLFEVLPAMYPTENMYFKAGLSQYCSKTLSIGNDNDFAVAYMSTLYGDLDRCFEVKKAKYVIPPKKKCNIVVTYWGKFVKKSRCTLILSGECKGYHYATSKVVSLTGEPDVTYTISETNVDLELYKVHELPLTISAPYQVAASYTLQYTHLECTTTEEVEAVAYWEKAPFFVIGQCMPTVGALEFNEEGVSVLVLWSYPVTMSDKWNWIFFRNKEVGDFAIKILTVVKKSAKQEVLRVELPRAFQNQDVNSICSRAPPQIFLRIPCRNRVIWNGLVQMMLKHITEDVQFWKEIVQTPTGMHILQRLLCFASCPWDSQYKICDSSEYEIIAENDCNVILPETIFIADKCSSDCVEVEIHLAHFEPRDFAMTLKSLDGVEIRQYRVQFVYKSDNLP